MSSKVFLAVQNNEDARAIIEALETDNPEATVENFPAMVKVSCEGRLVLNRKTVESLIGRDWDPQEVHISLISLSGNVDEDEDSFVLMRDNK